MVSSEALGMTTGAPGLGLGPAAVVVWILVLRLLGQLSRLRALVTDAMIAQSPIRPARTTSHLLLPAATPQRQSTCRLLPPMAQLVGDSLGEGLARRLLLGLQVVRQLLHPLIGHVASGRRPLSSGSRPLGPRVAGHPRRRATNVARRRRLRSEGCDQRSSRCPGRSLPASAPAGSRDDAVLQLFPIQAVVVDRESSHCASCSAKLSTFR